MDWLKQQQNIDRQICLKILTDNENLYASKAINFKNYYIIFSSRCESVQYFTGSSRAIAVLSFETIFQSFTDPENPTPEEFTMFRLQYGVDWIVEPKDLDL